MHSVFGWDLPPGCSTNDPYFNTDYPCDVCGQIEDKCICPECPVCGEYGNPKCYSNHELIINKEQIESKIETHEIMEEFIEKENAFWDNPE